MSVSIGTLASTHEVVLGDTYGVTGYVGHWTAARRNHKRGTVTLTADHGDGPMRVTVPLWDVVVLPLGGHDPADVPPPVRKATVRTDPRECPVVVHVDTEMPVVVVPFANDYDQASMRMLGYADAAEYERAAGWADALRRNHDRLPEYATGPADPLAQVEEDGCRMFVGPEWPGVVCLWGGRCVPRRTDNRCHKCGQMHPEAVTVLAEREARLQGEAVALLAGGMSPDADEYLDNRAQWRGAWGNLSRHPQPVGWTPLAPITSL